MQPDVSPDGNRIAFDLLGDIYVVPIAGGTARPVLTGPAHESHPAFSPDGRHLAFVSDRGGTPELWVADADGGNARRAAHETELAVFAQPAWTRDGASIVVSRMVHALLGFELWSYPAAGGRGAKLTSAQPSGDDDWSERHNALGAVPAQDGSLVYATKRGDTFIAKPPAAWSVVRRTPDGREETLASGPGGAFAPALSSDGRFLAYARREDSGTVLRLRTVATGEDRRLAALDHDGQEGGYYAGILPRFRFLPGDASLLLARGGKLARLDLATGATIPIAFSAPVVLDVRRALRPAVSIERGPVRARIIQAPRLALDGVTLAFSAFGRLHLAGRDGTARVLAGAGERSYMPDWSPDGRRIAFVRWDEAAGGAVWTIGADGRGVRRLTASRAFYTEPTFSPDGRHVAALRASHDDRVAAETEIAPDRPTAIVLIDAATGAERVVARLPAARALGWAADGRSLDVYTPEGLRTVAVANGRVHTLTRIVGLSPSRYVGAPVAVDEAQLSPDRRRLLIRHGAQLWVVPLPASGNDGPPTIDLGALPRSARLTRVGADTARWLADGGIGWSVGSTWRRLPSRVAPGPDAEALAETRTVTATTPRSVPGGSTVLTGATLLTMRGDEAIENGEIVVTGDRIVAVGQAGMLSRPHGARVLDLRGQTIIPGLVDAHAHWWNLRRNVYPQRDWNLALNLAFGVTSGLDVQPFTTDVFTYGDMVEAGLMPGPRMFSTGPGYFRNSPHRDQQDVADVLTRYRDHYRTSNLKAYMIGNRADRMRIAAAARATGVIATTEGASDLPLGLTHIVDGFAGQEHTLPVTPLRDDVVRLLAFARTSYTPTLGALYGGGSATDAFGIREAWNDDLRIRCLMPAALIAAKRAAHRWLPPEAQTYRRFAADALRVQRAGGLVGMGSHGEIQGLGMHWEMVAYVEGGATPMEALAAATVGSAETIGRHLDLGSLAPGKLADLVILTADPRRDIRHTQAIAAVMRGGTLATPPCRSPSEK